MSASPTDSTKPVLVIGVSGSSSCYKVCNLIRIFRSSVEHHVVMTAAAARFVHPRLFRVLTGNPVLLDLFDETFPSTHPHVWLARKVSVFLIAPATANTLSRLAYGNASDALSTLALSIPPTSRPCFVAPAMMPSMFKHPAVIANLQRLKEMGYRIIPPASGVLADGMKGVGKLAEPEDIAAAIRGSLWPPTPGAANEEDRLDAAAEEALDLFHVAVRMHDEGEPAEENHVGHLELDDLLLGQVSSLTLLRILSNVEALVKESRKVQFSFWGADKKLAFDPAKILVSVRTFVTYFRSRLEKLEIAG